MSRVTKVYKEIDGDQLTVASGGELEVESGGVIDVETGGALKLAGTAISASAAELNVVDGATAGTVVASKAAVVDANKDIGDFRNLDAQNIDAGASGTVGSVDVFPTTAAKGKLTLACADQTGDTAVTVQPDEMGQATTVHIPDPGAADSYVVQSTAALTLAEADILDGATVSTDELNALDGAPFDVDFTIGAEAANVINVGIQLNDAGGSALAARASVFAYLSDDANGDSIAATAPDGGWAIGTDGLLIPVVANKAAQLVSESDGDIDIDITESGALTVYLILVLPNGLLVASTAITFAA